MKSCSYSPIFLTNLLRLPSFTFSKPALRVRMVYWDQHWQVTGLCFRSDLFLPSPRCARASSMNTLSVIFTGRSRICWFEDPVSLRCTSSSKALISSQKEPNPESSNVSKFSAVSARTLIGISRSIHYIDLSIIRSFQSYFANSIFV